MAIPVVKSVFLDTKVLIAASTPERSLHKQALAVFNQPPKEVNFYWSGQIVREYLVVATRSLSQNGLGLDVKSALGNIKAFSSRCSLLDDNSAVAAALRKLLLETETTGKQVHDANIVATSISHGVKEILTDKIDDFRRFKPWIAITSLKPES